ncbi:ArsR/SmtB family transcription factor [Algihabitans albus]|uniref:ArsR/SmtB family transcription factor n=1 Tax=Algihabitans albus TaxID=2164067 RepID=UPI001F3F535F|nr:metalloregulator ArsR/SmtB family transcription factor [Algihabitans albus]
MTSLGREAAPAVGADRAVDQMVAKARALGEMEDGAERAAEFLKALSNRHRLIVLCLLAERERTVGELEDILMIRQPTLSQQLARLRAEALVETRRDGKRIYYRLASDETRKVIELLYGMFCSPEAKSASA